MIKFSIERLYHFSCGECNSWFSVGDWHVQREQSATLTCPHCGVIQEVEQLVDGVNPSTAKGAELTLGYTGDGGSTKAQASPPEAVFDADNTRFRPVFEETIASLRLPLKRKGDGYRSPITQWCFEVAYGVVNRLRLYEK